MMIRKEGGAVWPNFESVVEHEDDNSECLGSWIRLFPHIEADKLTLIREIQNASHELRYPGTDNKIIVHQIRRPICIFISNDALLSIVCRNNKWWRVNWFDYSDENKRLWWVWQVFKYGAEHVKKWNIQ